MMTVYPGRLFVFLRYTETEGTGKRKCKAGPILRKPQIARTNIKCTPWLLRLAPSMRANMEKPLRRQMAVLAMRGVFMGFHICGVVSNINGWEK